MKIKLFLLIIFSAFIVSCVFTKQQMVSHKSQIKDIFSIPDGSILKVRLADNELNLVVANSPKAKAEGLSNKEKIPEDGMIFFFYESDIQSFWMKEMKFPIDIIWISGNEVAGIEKNVPIPISTAKIGDLKIYKSPQRADTVIELEAGSADKLNIVFGSILEVSQNYYINGD
ncbi:MAG: DUF192 domain-containing protein [Endomicrobium sp.]|jgi:uncharacterized membrane protein (UPF0127 family)|nr:DUF192 domain-containing protein [Endomicrobium sp.]